MDKEPPKDGEEAAVPPLGTESQINQGAGPNPQTRTALVLLKIQLLQEHHKGSLGTLTVPRASHHQEMEDAISTPQGNSTFVP